MTALSRSDEPFEVEISGAGFSRCARFATAGEAYAKAREIRDTAETGEPVGFTGAVGDGGVYRVLAVRVLRWNPLTGDVLSHARRWTLTDTPPDALTPLPASWHHDPLPDDWYRSPRPRNEEPMTRFTLTRTLPDGTVKTNPTALRTLREVEFAVAYCLMDNSRVPRGEARTFAADFARRPAGEQVKHDGSGYTFRVDRA